MKKIGRAKYKSFLEKSKDSFWTWNNWSIEAGIDQGPELQIWIALALLAGKPE